MFGRNLISLRAQNNLTQEQLAERLGVTRSAYSKWETRSTEPDYSMLVKIKKALNCTYEELLEGD